MKHSLFLAGALAVSTLGAFAQTAPDNHQAQAGVRLGRVFIGDSRAAVGRRLGKPTRTFTLGRGLTSQLWRGKKPGDTGRLNTLEVVYRSGVVIQIEATSLVFKTPGGLSLSSARDEWEDAYGKPAQTDYYYDSSGARKRYLDWKRSGIALELLESGDGGGEFTYQTLIVHRKGYSVIPDRGGVRE